MIYASLDSFKDDLVASGFVDNGTSIEEHQYNLLKLYEKEYSGEGLDSTFEYLKGKLKESW